VWGDSEQVRAESKTYTAVPPAAALIPLLLLIGSRIDSRFEPCTAMNGGMDQEI